MAHGRGTRVTGSELLRAGNRQVYAVAESRRRVKLRRVRVVRPVVSSGCVASMRGYAGYAGCAHITTRPQADRVCVIGERVVGECVMGSMWWGSGACRRATLTPGPAVSQTYAGPPSLRVAHMLPRRVSVSANPPTFSRRSVCQFRSRSPKQIPASRKKGRERKINHNRSKPAFSTKRPIVSKQNYPEFLGNFSANVRSRLDTNFQHKLFVLKASFERLWLRCLSTAPAAF
jgi:hypothetical protein